MRRKPQPGGRSGKKLHHGRSAADQGRRRARQQSQRAREVLGSWQPDEEQVLAALARQTDTVGLGQLAESMALDGRDSVRALARVLGELKLAGQVMEPRPGRFLIAGAGGEFPVIIEPGDDLQLAARFTNGRLVTLHPGHRLGAQVGDQGLAMIDQQGRALVTRLLQRSGRETCGTLVFLHNRPRFVPDNRKEGDLHVINSLEDLRSRYRVGERVIGEVLREGNDFAVRLLRMLDEDSPDVADFTHVRLAYDLPGPFPQAVEAAAESCDERMSLEGREDLREELIFTIDPATAKDFDDAISLSPLGGGGWRVGVHIADVSHFVRPRTPLDDEALLRGTSIYLQNRVIPMLPEVLSNGLCSLRPEEDRYALSVFIDLDRQLRVRQVRPMESLIRSQHRLSYEQALDILEGRDEDWSEDLVTVIRQAGELAQGLRSRRERDGSLNLFSVEHDFALDQEGNPLDVVQESGDIAHQLIEEFMLLANRCVARWLHDHHCPTVYRVHGEPDHEKLAFFNTLLASYGITDADVFSRFGLQALLNRLADEPRTARIVLNSLCLRCFQKAIYSIENIGHHALAFKHYLHFTSPIRRYPDLIIHRLVKQVLGLPGYRDSDVDRAHLDAFARQCSYLEQRAVSAERDLHRIKAARYLHGRIGDCFAGVVTGVARQGLFVQLLETGLDGMVPLRELRDDFYEFDPERLSLIGRRTGRVLGIGMECAVQVIAVDIVRAEVDLGFAPDNA